MEQPSDNKLHVPIATILEGLAKGVMIDGLSGAGSELLTEYPDLKREDVAEALRRAAVVVATVDCMVAHLPNNGGLVPLAGLRLAGKAKRGNRISASIIRQISKATRLDAASIAALTKPKRGKGGIPVLERLQVSREEQRRELQDMNKAKPGKGKR
jgi:uncharacterized protein (DUF433 family)